jgi:hypothetical protein
MIGKLIPPESSQGMSQKEQKLMQKFHEMETHIMKTVQTGVTQETAVTFVDQGTVVGTQLGSLVLAADQAFLIVNSIYQPAWC